MEKDNLNKKLNKKLFNVVDKFISGEKIISVQPYGEGHINHTYIVTTDKKRYILQTINDYVFPDVDGLMNNICGVTEHIAKKGAETLAIMHTKDGKSYVRDGEPYRLFAFNENTISLQTISDERVFKNIGYAFGTFQNQLADYDATTLVEVIPDFHNTPKRFENFVKVLNADAYDRAKLCKNEIQFVLDRKRTLNKVTEGIKDGSIPLRVTHNDTKINNILVDAITGAARAVVDLDTVMPGSLLYDFGDAVRFGAATAREDEADLSVVNINLKLFKAYAEGFYSAVKETITAKEKELLAYSVYLMTFEVGMRFLTDYLDGDKYFSICYDDHNLVRAKNQLKMVKEIENNFDKMEEIVKGL